MRIVHGIKIKQLKFSIMNQRTVFFFLFAFAGLLSWATDEEIVLNHPGQQHDHIEYFLPADAPQAYFDTDELEIIIVGDGFADYYDVEIVSLATMQSVICTQISGYGDSIDVSSLPDGNYHIVIHTSNNNVYDGFFAIE